MKQYLEIKKIEINYLISKVEFQENFYFSSLKDIQKKFVKCFCHRIQQGCNHKNIIEMFFLSLSF